MKVLLISGANGGGGGSACFRLHTALLKAGVESKLLFLEKTGDNTQPESYDFFDNKAKLYAHKAWNKFVSSKTYKIKNLPKGTETFYFPFSAFDLSDHPLAKWADVINLHWVSNIIDFPSFFKKINKPIVWTLHDMEPFSGGYAYLEHFPLDVYEEIIAKNEKVKIKALERSNLSIVCPSKWLLNESKKSTVFSRFKHYHIPYGLDNKGIFAPRQKAFSRNLFGIPDNAKVILFVATSLVNRRKGFDLLIKAFENIDREDITLAILGTGKVDGLDHIKNKVFLGKIKDELLMSLAYSAADVFVIPSIEDNLPNVVLESISCGTPVVGFNIGGIPDMVIPQKNGTIASEVTASSLADAISEAIDTQFDREWICNDAKSRYFEDIQATAYSQLYSSLI
jgi:glycosyltransferase involved in cell wall biosynthesis